MSKLGNNIMTLRPLAWLSDLQQRPLAHLTARSLLPGATSPSQSTLESHFFVLYSSGPLDWENRLPPGSRWRPRLQVDDAERK